ncbi:hypothetical protein CLPU_2c00180 [Gottschalkia purinilytica]|uniref:Sporulation protein Cse60 n=1 Tax=Gottschalkia purinilytica TaxID=1503 RepID=A0A0L0WDL5_GOTPU|nr:hypothetical protein [Gottschalkia purinilytica]KNF09567.1 hypothetical protein CLPU_2c00180 [Gottschalkia purinilytica]
MKHVTIMEYTQGDSLKDKVDQWISENEHEILEIIDIEYSQRGDNIYLATITYEEREEESE